MIPPVQATHDWLEAVRRRVDARLESALSEIIADAMRSAPQSVPIIEEVRALTLRGGKRVRAALVVAGVEAIGSGGALDAAVDDVCASIELLQTYLLIHDDWIDGDAVRRGGPSVHVALARRFESEKLGGPLAILAGDYASALAQHFAASTTIPSDRVADTTRALVRMQRDVVLGQTLDVIGTAELDVVHDLKTTSYTVRGPLALGHALAGGSPRQWTALEAFARPCGLAFQLRDDMIGTFGDAREAGKPVGSDLRAGKHTAPVRHALEHLQGSARAQLSASLGRDDDAAVESARALLRVSGAIDAVEQRISSLRDEAVRALDVPDLNRDGRGRLADLAWLMTERKK
jgi:geranylgeranyl diphosphate synthase type I